MKTRKGKKQNTGIVNDDNISVWVSLADIARLLLDGKVFVYPCEGVHIDLTLKREWPNP